MGAAQLFAAFCGGSNTERSLAIDAEQTTNLFRATVEAQGAAKSATLVGTPGTRQLGEVVTGDPTVAGRGVFTQDGVSWTVLGGGLYEVTVNPWTATFRGFVADDHQPVSWASNGDVMLLTADPPPPPQLAFVSGGNLYVLDRLTNILALVALPLMNAPRQIGFIDGYFVLLERDSPRWYFTFGSALVWDALDVIVRQTASDNFVALAVANNRVWGFGSETSEAFEDVGDEDTPFQPIKGSLFQIGCAAPWSVSIGVNTLRWLGRSSRGGAMVYRLDGYGGARISTHAIEQALEKAATLVDCEALTYDQDGHLFYALTCPSVGTNGWTPVWDETEQQWHKRSWWNQALAREEAWRVRGHAYIGATHLVGSRDSSVMWALDLETYDDAGALLRAARRAPYLGADNGWVFLDEIELGIESGSGLNLGQGRDPQALLNISTDSGKTWTSAGMAPLGKMGETEASCIWRRCGRARLDRLVLEVVITDPVKRVLGPGLWIRATPGLP